MNSQDYIPTTQMTDQQLLSIVLKAQAKLANKRPRVETDENYIIRGARSGRPL